jgi:hypothetical protein
MGSIITEVAVLEIHMDKKAVAIINPKMIFRTSEPIILMMFKAMRLCRFHFSIALEYTVGLSLFPTGGGQKSFLEKQKQL